MIKTRSFSLFFIASFFILLFVKCKSQEKISNSDTFHVSGDQNDSLFLYLERTPCFGRCSTYVVSVYSSGYVVYEGKQFVTRIGKHAAWMDKDKMQSLVNEALKLKYTSLKDEYKTEGVADLPITKSSIVIDGKRKSVFNDNLNPPAELTSFEKYIDSVFDDSSIRWKNLRNDE